LHRGEDGELEGEEGVNAEQSFIHDVTEALRPLDKAYCLGEWESSTTGTEEANRRNAEAQAAYMRFFSDPKLFERARRMSEAGASRAGSARQLELIRLACSKYRQSESAIDELTRLEAEVRSHYYTYRAVVAGKKRSDNQIEVLLRDSTDSDAVREAWLASKVVGVRVADTVRELARVRNRSAREQGWRDHFQRSLAVDEIDEAGLIATFDALDKATQAPFRALKERIDALRSARFGITPEELRPWHYGDRFFQEAPPLGPDDVGALFDGRDPVALAAATYDGLGMDVRDILERSDLYARLGKNQHAFCVNMDRCGDVRVLANALPDKRWADTMLHELGHAVYEKYLDPGLPWLLRAPSHMLTTEAVAILMGSLTVDAEWLDRILGIPEDRAGRIAEGARDADRAEGLLFTRWCLVMTNFEKAFYEDPERDLDGLWWDLVERHQLVRRPEGRKAADWAAKIHIALAPVYYQNYELGRLVRAQLMDRLGKAGGIVGRREAGRWLIEKVFRPGASLDWTRHVQEATGEALDPRYFTESVG
jgi:peptidyl-dipeptidase A